MSERELNVTGIPNAMAPVVGIGGLLSVKTQWFYYTPLLASPGSALSAKERFLPIPDRGLSPFDEMYGQLKEQLHTLHERLEERVVLFGHSLGALMAIRLGLENPDMVSDVECLAGIQDGVDEFTFSGKALKKLLGSPDHAENLLRGSDFMTEHRREIATEWPAQVPLHLISPTHDVLIPAPQGLEVELPAKQQPNRLIVVPRVPGLHSGIRKKTEHLPNVKELRPLLPAEHVDLPICPAVILHTRQIRRAAAENTEEAAIPGLAHGLVPIPAAA